MTPSERLALLATSGSPALVGRLGSGFVVMGENQFLEGYCLLLAFPEVEQLLDLEPADRRKFLEDMARVGEAVKAATRCRRVNFSIYGNLDPFLHAHIWPRYDHEPEEFRTLPPFNYPAEYRNKPEAAFSVEKHAELKARIQKLLGL